MRRLVFLYALFCVTPLAAQPWLELKASVQAKHPTYDASYAPVAAALLSKQEPDGNAAHAVIHGAHAILALLPHYIQQTINKWPVYWPDDTLKWQSIAHMHHAKCILAGAAQIVLALKINEKKSWQQQERFALSQMLGPPTRMLMGEPNFGPTPDDTALRRQLGANLFEVQCAFVGGEDRLAQDIKTMLTFVKDCPQVRLGYCESVSS